MKKYTETYKSQQESSWFHYFILKFNQFTSNFGQSYIRPLQLIFLVATVLYFIDLGLAENIHHKIYSSGNPYIEIPISKLNLFARCILPFKNMLKEGKEFITLFFHIILGTLIWQTIVAIKRHTKR